MRSVVFTVIVILGTTWTKMEIVDPTLLLLFFIFLVTQRFGVVKSTMNITGKFIFNRQHYRPGRSIFDRKHTVVVIVSANVNYCQSFAITKNDCQMRVCGHGYSSI